MFYKTLLLLLIPITCLCQPKGVGSCYVVVNERTGKTQELKLLKNDSFYYKVKDTLALAGTYRVNEDSLILSSSKLPPGYPLFFRIKNKKKLVAFYLPRIQPVWHLKESK